MQKTNKHKLSRLIHIGFIGLFACVGAMIFTTITDIDVMPYFMPVFVLSGVLILVGLLKGD